MLSRTFATRTIAVMSLALAAACGDGDNEGDNENNACPAGQVREGNRCVTPGGNNGNDNDNGGSADGCTDDDATNFDASADTDDGSCVYAVTFSVDMTGFDTSAGVTVSVSNGETYTLTDSGTDDVWTGEGNIASGNYFFRFLLGADAEEVPLACNDNPGGTFTERSLTVSDAPVATPVYPFAECIPLMAPLAVDTYWFASGFIGDGGTAGNVIDDTTACPTRAGDQRGSCHAITYNVSSEGFAGIFWQFPDGNFTEAGDGRRVETTVNELTFWAWSENGGESVEFIAGSDIDDFKASRTLTLTDTPAEYTIEFTTSSGVLVTPFSWVIADTPNSGNSYTFYIDDIALNAESTAVVQGCTDSDANNFDSTATADDGSCTYDLTFQLDMSAETFDPLDGVFVTGDFGADVELLDVDGDDVYTGIASAAPGSYTYSYYIGSEPRVDEIVPSACDAGGGARAVMLMTAPLTLPVDPFGGCSDDVLGCTDPDAANYNIDATIDNGTCQYAFAASVDLSARDGATIALGMDLLTRMEGMSAFGETALTDTSGVFEGEAVLPPGDYEYRFRIGAAGGENSPVRRFSIVDAPVVIDAGAFDEIRAELPMVVSDHYGAGGFFPNADDTTLDFDCPARPSDARGDCYHFNYVEAGGGDFAGVNWLNGESFGTEVARAIDAGATQVSFYAWSSTAGKQVDMGYNHTADGSQGGVLPLIALTTTPTRYTVDLVHLYDRVLYPFIWAAAGAASPLEFWVTDIVWEEAPTPAPQPVPLVVDDAFAGRAIFNDGTQYVETLDCPIRARAGAVGDCHRISWDGAGSFTGGFWLNGSGFGNNTPVPVEAGATALSFYAWGATGGESLEAGVGLAGRDPAEFRPAVTLSDTPQRFLLPVVDRVGPDFDDYRAIVSGFNFALTSAAEVFIDDIQWITVGITNSDPADGDITRVGTGTPTVADTVGALARVGYFGPAAADPQAAFVFGFPLSDVLTQDSQVTDASLRVRVFAQVGTIEFNADLVGLGYRGSPDIAAADFDAGTIGTLIQEDFVTPSVGDQEQITIADGAKTTLVDFLNAQLTAGAVPGDYVFFRIQADAANPGNGPQYYQINTANEGVAGAAPQLTYDVECTECLPFTTGCTSPTANNFDSSAILDDGSCRFDVTFTVDMGCPDPDDAFTSVQLSSDGVTVDLTDQGAGIWSGIAEVQEGAFTYRFATDAGEEDLLDDRANGEQCAPVSDDSTFAYRQAAVSGSMTSFGGLYGHCEATCFDVFLADAVEYVADGADTQLQKVGASDPVLGNPAAGSALIQDVGANGTNVVFPFQLPAQPPGGFTVAQFEVELLNANNSPSFDVDAYVLPPSGTLDDPTVDPVLAYFSGDEDTTAGVVRFAESFITPLTPAGPNQLVRSGEAASTALVDFINALYAGGDVSGQYIYIRLSPKVTPPGVEQYEITTVEGGPDPILRLE